MISAHKPNNGLPPIPVNRLETPATLKAAIQASRNLAALKAAGPRIPNQAMLLKSILLQEAKSSSEIENVVTTNDALYRAFDFNPELSDSPSREVLRYGDALWSGFEEVKSGIPIRPSLIIKLVQEIKGADISVRERSGCHIVNDLTKEVIYTPPVGKDLILKKLDSMCEFLAQESKIDPLIAMAAAHRQFEAIHPFPDGNGRTGRVLNVLFLVQAELLEVPILYLSRFILRNKPEYYRLLRAVTEEGEWEPWILFMLTAVSETATLTLQMLKKLRLELDLAANLARTGMKRGYSHELIELVFARPLTRITHLEEAGIAKRNTASQYLRSLEMLGILESVHYGREHLFFNRKLMDSLAIESSLL